MPVTVTVGTEPSYDVRIGPGVLAEAAAALPRDAPSALVTDPRVAELHAGRLGAAAGLARWLAPRGEAAKRMAELERLLEFLAESGLERGSALLVLGGGSVGDLGGLAAALFHRGIAFVSCPTTLLAQVDASVGGKTAVDLAAGKNLAGAFHQPRAVLADTAVLATLDEEELASGLGEVVKCAVLDGPDLLERAEARVDALRAGEPEALAEVVEACVRHKAAIVAADPLDRGPRRSLNLGHTFAHAIERAAGFGRVPHGVAVGVGIVLALRASRRAGLLADERLEKRVRSLLGRAGLARDLDELRERCDLELDPEAILAATFRDKKARSGAPRFVLVERAGRARWDVTLDRETVRSLLAGRS